MIRTRGFQQGMTMAPCRGRISRPGNFGRIRTSGYERTFGVLLLLLLLPCFVVSRFQSSLFAGRGGRFRRLVLVVVVVAGTILGAAGTRGTSDAAVGPIFLLLCRSNGKFFVRWTP